MPIDMCSEHASCLSRHTWRFHASNLSRDKKNQEEPCGGGSPGQPAAGLLEEAVAVRGDIGIKRGRQWRVRRWNGDLHAVVRLGLLAPYLQKLAPLPHLQQQRVT